MTYNIPFEKEVCCLPKYEIYLCSSITLHYRWGNGGLYLFRGWDLPRGTQLLSNSVNTTLLYSFCGKRQKLKSNVLKRKVNVIGHIYEKLKSCFSKTGSRCPSWCPGAFPSPSLNTALLQVGFIPRQALSTELLWELQIYIPSDSSLVER